MPNFKYVGTRTKPNGKVDVNLPRCSHGTEPIEVLDVTPNETVIAVADPCHVAMLLRHKDVSKHPPEALFAEIA